MGGFRLFLIGCLLGLVQGSLEKSWAFPGPAPDLLLLYVVWLGMSFRTSIGLMVAFFGGLLEDSVTALDPVGLHSLARLFAAYLPEWGRLILIPESRISGGILVAAGTLLQSMIILSISQTLSPTNLWSLGVLQSWGASVILNGGVWFLLTLLFLPRMKLEYG